MSGSAARASFPPPTTPRPDARVLVLYCHPAAHRSRVNRALVDVARRVEGVTVHDLYEASPDLVIDVPREQALLLAHPVIVFQHPLYWYSTPALLKEWQDQVLRFGWAYGPGGTALAGKRVLTATTTGGARESYRPDGAHGITLRELLAPIAQTARLCRMQYLPPLAVHGAFHLDDGGLARAVVDYAAVLEALRDDRLDADATTGDGLLDVARATRGGGAH